MVGGGELWIRSSGAALLRLGLHGYSSTEEEDEEGEEEEKNKNYACGTVLQIV
jgi:hypothetical protein